MITGTVNSDLEAIVRLHVEDVKGQTQAIDVKIDTAFTAFINLPTAMIAALGLPVATHEYVRIADGSVVRVPVHVGIVIWEGRPRRIEFHALGQEKLIGMAMLAGHDLTMRVRDGGAVTITLVP